MDMYLLTLNGEPCLLVLLLVPYHAMTQCFPFTFFHFMMVIDKFTLYCFDDPPLYTQTTLVHQKRSIASILNSKSLPNITKNEPKTVILGRVNYNSPLRI